MLLEYLQDEKTSGTVAFKPKSMAFFSSNPRRKDILVCKENISRLKWHVYSTYNLGTKMNSEVTHHIEAMVLWTQIPLWDKFFVFCYCYMNI